MTLILSWLARDQRKTSAVYIASDSRISWPLTTITKNKVNPLVIWDNGRKLFIFRSYPDIIAYCGKALFPTQVITQAVDIFDMRTNSNTIDFPERVTQFITLLKQQLDEYPVEILNNFEILMAGRYLDAYRFGRYHVSWHSGKWHEDYIEENTKLFETAIILGSGIGSFEDFYATHYKKSDMHNFSRAGFTALSEYLKQQNKEIHCGGATQLVAIYNKHQPRVIGTIFNGERFLIGAKVTGYDINDEFDWRDEIFQRVKPDSFDLLENAQRHAKIKNKK